MSNKHDLTEPPSPARRDFLCQGGAVLAWAAGWWGLREVLNRPVVETLRRAAAE